MADMLMKLKGGFLIGIFVIFSCSEETNIHPEQAALSAPPSILSGKVEYVSDVSSMANQFYSNADILVINEPKTLTTFWGDYGKNQNSSFDIAKIQQLESSVQLAQQGWIMTSLDSRGVFNTATPEGPFVVCLANISTKTKQGYWMIEGCTDQIPLPQRQETLIVTFGESGVGYYWEKPAD
ncbi:MAG: hypothetical protein CMP19_03380 [Rickettsiales bacterium]|uniref:Lipoprotein n=1 Tax=Alteromonas naphthalenivorans TaxID=715451 RepID=F5Z9R6_ALTNA|nr:hypothetical protein [Alteromonas naphthalenivorans]AEF02071.1 hypothetical protein ambt_02585 [Alteromonas naphthalenivorans]MBB66551.1 hypothetical protein [Rickettsiales bacterium]